MYAIVVWLTEDTLVPSVIGPYEGDQAFDDATLIRMRAEAHKVQVCNMTEPEASGTIHALKRLV